MSFLSGIDYTCTGNTFIPEELILQAKQSNLTHFPNQYFNIPTNQKYKFNPIHANGILYTKIKNRTQNSSTENTPKKSIILQPFVRLFILWGHLFMFFCNSICRLHLFDIFK